MSNTCMQICQCRICSSELRAFVGDSREPYRDVLAQIRTRLSATRDWALGRLQGLSVEDNNVYTNSEEILEPLLLCYRSLNESKMGSIARGELSDTIRRLACFGISLLRLDIRQESSRHTDALSAVTEALRTWKLSRVERGTKAIVLASLPQPSRR